jgi:hypothetical protein
MARSSDARCCSLTYAHLRGAGLGRVEAGPILSAPCHAIWPEIAPGCPLLRRGPRMAPNAGAASTHPGGRGRWAMCRSPRVPEEETGRAGSLPRFERTAETFHQPMPRTIAICRISKQGRCAAPAHGRKSRCTAFCAHRINGHGKGIVLSPTPRPWTWPEWGHILAM